MLLSEVKLVLLCYAMKNTFVVGVVDDKDVSGASKRQKKLPEVRRTHHMLKFLQLPMLNLVT